MAEKKKRKLEGAFEDLEDPIDESTRTDLLAAFSTLRSLSLSMFSMPGDTLLGRVYRKFKRGTMRILPIKKAISLYLTSLPREQ